MADSAPESGTQETEDQLYYPYKHVLLTPEFFKVKYSPPSSVSHKPPTSTPPRVQRRTAVPHAAAVKRARPASEPRWRSHNPLQSDREGQEDHSSLLSRRDSGLPPDSSSILTRRDSGLPDTPALLADHSKGFTLKLADTGYINNESGQGSEKGVDLVVPSLPHKHLLMANNMGAAGDKKADGEFGETGDPEVDTHNLMLLPEIHLPHCQRQPPPNQSIPSLEKGSRSPPPGLPLGKKLPQEAVPCDRTDEHKRSGELKKDKHLGAASQPSLRSALDRNVWRESQSRAKIPGDPLILEQKRISRVLDEYYGAPCGLPGRARARGAGMLGLGLPGSSVSAPRGAHGSRQSAGGLGSDAQLVRLPLPKSAGGLASDAQLVQLALPAPLQQIPHTSWIGVQPTSHSPRTFLSTTRPTAPPSSLSTPNPPVQGDLQPSVFQQAVYDPTATLPQSAAATTVTMVTYSTGRARPTPTLLSSMVTVAPPTYVGTPPSYVGTSPTYMATPPTYMATPTSYVATPPSYVDTPPSYVGTPPVQFLNDYALEQELEHTPGSGVDGEPFAVFPCPEGTPNDLGELDVDDAVEAFDRICTEQVIPRRPSGPRREDVAYPQVEVTVESSEHSETLPDVIQEFTNSSLHTAPVTMAVPSTALPPQRLPQSSGLFRFHGPRGLSAGSEPQSTHHQPAMRLSSVVCQINNLDEVSDSEDEEESLVVRKVVGQPFVPKPRHSHSSSGTHSSYSISPIGTPCTPRSPADSRHSSRPSTPPPTIVTTFVQTSEGFLYGFLPPTPPSPGGSPPTDDSTPQWVGSRTPSPLSRSEPQRGSPSPVLTRGFRDDEMFQEERWHLGGGRQLMAADTEVAEVFEYERRDENFGATPLPPDSPPPGAGAAPTVTTSSGAEAWPTQDPSPGAEATAGHTPMECALDFEIARDLQQDFDQQIARTMQEEEGEGEGKGWRHRQGECRHHTIHPRQRTSSGSDDHAHPGYFPGSGHTLGEVTGQRRARPSTLRGVSRDEEERDRRYEEDRRRAMERRWGSARGPPTTRAAATTRGHQVDLSYESLLELEDVPRGMDMATITTFSTLHKYKLRAAPTLATDIPEPTSPSKRRCCVCLEDFEDQQLVRSLPCFHQFHRVCIDRWLITNRQCPVCMEDILEQAKKVECDSVHSNSSAYQHLL